MDISCKYHHLEICSNTSGIDNLFFHYEQNRKETVDLVLNNPDRLLQSLWGKDSTIAIDNECRCEMGKRDLRSVFSCSQCKNLRRINCKLDCVNKHFQLQCGKLAGKNMIIYNTNILDPFIQWDKEAEIRAKNLVKQYQMLKLCGTPDISNIRCISGDSFTIRTLLSWIIYDFFNKKSLPHIPLLYTTFICKNMGYSLYEYPNIGTLDDMHKFDIYHNKNSNSDMRSQHTINTSLKSSVSRSIIIQLLVILKELSKINFSHGSPCINDLIFNSSPVSYMYDGFHVVSDFTMQITNFWNSSAMLNNIHLFSKKMKTDIGLGKFMFIPEIIKKNVATATCSGACQDIIVYKITSENVDLYISMREIGFPIFVGSFDFYCYMVSLMCDKSFYDSLIKDKNLYRLWTVMWTPEDLINIEKNIKESQELEMNLRTSNINIINIIRGSWLRCDIIDHMWDLIKNGW